MNQETPTGRITKDFTFDVKNVTDEGVIEGYASVFDVIDDQGDVILPGAFTRTINAWAAKGRPIPVLWQHDAFAPIGATTSITEDDRGLRVRASLAMGVQRAREAHELAKAKVLGGLSIGFSVPKLASDGQPAIVFDDERDARLFREVRLWEYSLVTFPANEAATITSVKEAGPPEWAADLTEAVHELRAVLDHRETLRLLREVRTILSHASAEPPGGRALDREDALADLLRHTTQALKQIGREAP